MLFRLHLVAFGVGRPIGNWASCRDDALQPEAGGVRRFLLVVFTGRFTCSGNVTVGRAVVK